MHAKNLVGLIVMIAMTAPGTVEADFELVRDGAPRSVIVLPEEPADAERKAADELVEHLELMSGAALQVVTRGGEPAGLLQIRIGDAADADLDAAIRKRGYDDPYAFALVVDGKTAQLRGLAPEGSLAAAYELLEQLGVRWYMPGDIGRVVPRRDTVTLSSQRTVQAPSYEGRRGPGQRGRPEVAVWLDRLRFGGKGRYGAHGIAPLSGGRAGRYFEEDTNLFALVNGERRRRQLCLTYSTDNIEENKLLQLVANHYREYLRDNPEVKVLNMGPNDGGGYCECDQCRTLDPPAHMTTPFSTPRPSFTDRYVWFFNRLTEALSDEFPGVRIGFYAYAAHLMPPAVVEAKDNLAISLAPIHVCRIHGPNNPVCPESNFPLWAYEKWRPYAGNYMADRGYLFNLADPGFPFSTVHRLREEMPAFHDMGVRIWAADPPSAWASHNPSAYLLGKLLWDHKTDVDALIEEFHALYYGPAQAPMKAYHTLMDHTIRDADHHTGSVWDIPFIYPPAVRSEARKHLEEAKRLAGVHDDPAFTVRVAITARALDFLDSYCEQRALRDDFDFEGALRAMERTAAIRDSLVSDFEYPMLSPRHARDLFSRFVERQAVQDHESTGGSAGTIVARFSHEWQFHIDPESWGRYAGFHKPESEGGNWRKIRTDTSWSNQGLRYYFGQAWYRQTVDVPDGFAGQKIFIWFSGVDNTAEVWVNGVFAGANHGGAEFDLDAFGSAFRPFQFDVTGMIRHGASNTVTIRVMRPGTNELGTGGLMGPVMFYVPGD